MARVTSIDSRRKRRSPRMVIPGLSMMICLSPRDALDRIAFPASARESVRRVAFSSRDEGRP
jgi:hypothetical protein